MSNDVIGTGPIDATGSKIGMTQMITFLILYMVIKIKQLYS